MTEAPDRTELRDTLLAAMLPHVPFDGWSRAALRHAAADAGIDAAMAVDAFPGGATDMVAHFSDWSDRRMLAALAALDTAAMRVPERIRAAVKLRLEQASPHREAVQRAVAFLALPTNAVLGARLLYRTVDAIWHAAGDTATDWNFYSKRGLLAGVFSSTVLYWLADRSEGAEDTWAFLDRRLADVARFGKTVAGFRKRFEEMPRRRWRPYRG